MKIVKLRKKVPEFRTDLPWFRTEDGKVVDILMFNDGQWISWVTGKPYSEEKACAQGEVGAR